MSDQKPNVLIVMTDQQSSWTLGCYGGTEIGTPHTDRIANEGVKFTHYYTNSASCTPSRGCFMTGRYPHAHGARVLSTPLHRDEITFAQIMQDNGYDTGYIGKWHLDGDASPGYVLPARSMGFRDCKYMINRTHRKEIIDRIGDVPYQSGNIGDEKTFMTDGLTDRAIAFMDEERHKPFLCMLSIPDPHHPFTVRPPYDTMFKPEDMLIPETFYQEELPDWVEDGAGPKNIFPLDMPDRENKLREIKAQYCGQTKCIDDNVGKALQYLEQKGILDDTIVIFTTDHGEYMGEHRTLKKNNLYETAYRIPLLIRWPKAIKAGGTIDKFVTTVDFQQTLLGLLRLDPCGREQGKDASPFLRGEMVSWTDESFVHPNEPSRTAIFTPDYELGYVQDGFKEHVLFDRLNDPLQVNNLYFDPKYKDIVAELTNRIVEHHKEVGTPPEVLPGELKHRFV